MKLATSHGKAAEPARVLQNGEKSKKAAKRTHEGEQTPDKRKKTAKVRGHADGCGTTARMQHAVGVHPGMRMLSLHFMICQPDLLALLQVKKEKKPKV